MPGSAKQFNFFKASAMLAFFGLLSRVAGLLRDRVLAGKFGASPTLDVYYSAFRIPDFIFNLIITGAIASAFIPMFVAEYKRSEREGWNLANNFLNVALVVVVGLSLLAIIFTPQLMPLVAPGFAGGQLKEAISLTRLLFLSPILFTFSTVAGAVLQSLKRFFAYSLAPIFYNLGIIFGALYLEPRLGIMGLGYGVVLGALLHVLVQVPSLRSAGFRWRALLHFGDRGLKKMVALMVPRTLGLASGQINLLVLNSVASTIAVGSITILNFANNAWIVPVSFIGISMATAVFPSLSDFAAGEEKEKFESTLMNVMKNMILLGIPATALMIIFRVEIIQVLLGAGQFNIADARLTGGIMALFALGIVPFALEQILNRAFYAMHHTVIPVVVSIFGDLVNVLFAILFAYTMPISFFTAFFNLFLPVADITTYRMLGLGMALSLANTLSFVVLWIGFLRFNPHRYNVPMMVFTLRVGLATLLSAMAYYVTIPYIALPLFSSSFLSMLTQLVSGVILFGIYFLVFAFLFRIQELRLLLSKGLRI